MRTAEQPAAMMVTAEQSAASLRGSEGGVIALHRTMATVPLTKADVGFAFALTGAFTAIALVLSPALFALWRWIFVAGSAALGLDGTLRHLITPVLHARVPMLDVDARVPGGTALVVAGLCVLVLLVIAQLVGDRALPLTYLLRGIAIVLGTAVAVYALDDSPPTLDLPAYTRTLLKVSAGIWIFVPVGYGLTFFLLNVSWPRKAALMALAMAHLALFVPLQVLVTQYVVQHLSLVVVPLFFVFAGVLPQVAVLIALYSWGASWPERTT